MLDPSIRSSIRQAFLEGNLKVQSVDPSTGIVGLHVVTKVLQHNTAHKPMAELTLNDGRSVTCTLDHSVFTIDSKGLPVAVEAGKVYPGTPLATVDEGSLQGTRTANVEILPPQEQLRSVTWDSGS